MYKTIYSGFRRYRSHSGKITRELHGWSAAKRKRIDDKRRKKTKEENSGTRLEAQSFKMKHSNDSYWKFYYPQVHRV
jgi:hypothetical protein